MDIPLNIRLHILSSVHIGCDDAYEPTSFFIDVNEKKLAEFDEVNFFKSLPDEDKRKFMSICAEGNIASILKIYKFISNKSEQIKRKKIIKVSDDFINHYKEVLRLVEKDEKNIKQNLNKFIINRTAYSPQSGLPYIPGSSLKGALRTAYLNKLVKDKDIKGYRGKAKDLEFELLGGGFAKDPFRMIKVSDLFLSEESSGSEDMHTGIVYAVNKKKKKSKYEASGPFQIVETIKEGSIFEGTINIQKPEDTADIKKPIEKKEFLNAINNFYKPAFNAENKIIKEIRENLSSLHKIVDVIKEKFRDKLGDTACLVRVGRHSGAEAVTIEYNRNIKIMQKKGVPSEWKDHATTIWLASNDRKPSDNSELTPFGWAIIELIS